MQCFKRYCHTTDWILPLKQDLNEILNKKSGRREGIAPRPRINDAKSESLEH